jgi:hypothetical protein
LAASLGQIARVTVADGRTTTTAHPTKNKHKRANLLRRLG